MKTTLELPDTLVEEASAVASRDQTSLQALVEEGLRHVLEERRSPASFRLRRATFRGQGVQPGIPEGDWTAIREILYEGRGA
ncbi:MAG TPA: DUF2191 domain-containing protein [Thermoanaerobaculia bacterium]|nr:DUF2191 domain-containing protein [Thermoanaerobaculia bacterium]